jgi:acetylornithine/succinyldiaminopimelate/putrescine aminotransferase
MDETPTTSAAAPDESQEIVEPTPPASPAPPAAPQDIVEQTRDLQLQAWQAQRAMDDLLETMTQEELKTYVDKITAQLQAFPDDSGDKAVWSALKTAAEFKYEQKRQEEEQVNG